MTLSESSAIRLQVYGQWRTVYEEASSRRDDLTGEFFPMSMVGACQRRLAYYYLNYPTAELSARALRTFEHGSWFEDWVKYTLTRYGSDYGISWDDPEGILRCDNPPCIGHRDLRIYANNPHQVQCCLDRLPYDGDRTQYIFNGEIKTAADYRFWDIVGGTKDKYRNNFIPNRGSILAAPDWYDQDVFYLGHILQKEPDNKGTILMMESKNENRVDVSHITFNPKRFNELLEKVNYIWLTVQNGELPGRIELNYNKYGKLGFPCTWTDGGCSYLEECNPPEEKE